MISPPGRRGRRDLRLADGADVTGPYVNVTMFDDAGVELPGEGATWDDWAAALTQVKDTLGLNAGLAMDRTAHRRAGPAFSYGARFFDESGTPILVDDGFRAFAETFVGWHEDGLTCARAGWSSSERRSSSTTAPATSSSPGSSARRG